jgi:pyruvate dehydrogenase E2 component (dihydrolipoamide acetyltransferase)
MPILVKMPKWGLMMKEGTVTEWLRAEGDAVAAGDPLFVVETDKAVNDVEAPGPGVLRRIVADAGTVVDVSGPVAVIAADGETLTDEAVDAFLERAAPARAAAAAGGAAAARATRAPRAAERDEAGRVKASPAARKLARELGIDLATVTATGGGGRVTSEDVERAAAGGGEGDDGAVREEWLDVGDGLRVYALSAGPGDAPAVVFLHGIGGSSTSWQGVVEAVAAGHRVVALDLPAHGQSDVPGAGAVGYDLAALADVVTRALALLAIERATLVGHSLGGAIAVAAAAAEPASVDRLVLVDPVGFGDEIAPELLALLDAAPSEAGSHALLELFFHDPALVLETGVREHHEALARPGAHAAVRAIRGHVFGDDRQAVRLDATLGALAQPVLVVWGEHDRVVPAAHAEAARATRADAEVAVVPGAGHAPQVEAPEAFTAVLLEFLGPGRA